MQPLWLLLIFFWAAWVRTKMPRLIVVTHAGDEVTIEGKLGISVMQTMRDGGVNDLLALCGGSCSCATCHVWVDPAFADKLPPAAEEEMALLEESNHLKGTSRLSCQLRLTDSLDGLRVTLAPDD
jgi:2Fe-2S ferredoxin